MKYAVVIPAAGHGSRFGSDKLSWSVAGKELLLWSVDHFLADPQCVLLVLATTAASKEKWKRKRPALLVVEGGDTRRQSVRHGLEKVRKVSPDLTHVLIHDGARPWLSQQVVQGLLEGLAQGYDAMIPLLPVNDSLRQIHGDTQGNRHASDAPIPGSFLAMKGESISREGVFAVQTPQAFRLAMICSAHEKARACAEPMAATTDDLSLIEAVAKEFPSALREAGQGVSRETHPKSNLSGETDFRTGYVLGDARTMKVTHPHDKSVAEAILRSDANCLPVSHPKEGTEMSRGGMPRVATGIDFHRFDQQQTGQKIAGVWLAKCPKLIGHSDADVVLHALTDAILSLGNQGDIGQLFPPTAAKWQDADSAVFLDAALRAIRGLALRICFIDITLIGERPKFSPYRDAIVESLAALCALSLSQVNVKATTTETMGALGRGEGLMAMATVTAWLPDSP